jgi:transposase
MSRRTYTPEFKFEAAQLIVKDGYSVRQAAEAINVSKSSIDKWARDLRKEQNGQSFSGSPLTPDQREIKDLKKRLKRVEMEKDILKKATALLMSDSLKNLR